MHSKLNSISARVALVQIVIVSLLLGALVSGQQQQVQLAPVVASAQNQPEQASLNLSSVLVKPATVSPAPIQADNGQQLELVEQHNHANPQSGNGNKDLWPMVNVDKHENKSKVDVHVPVFFDMSNHNDAQSGHSKLDLSVLQGLVTVSKDKTRDQDGQSSGPTKVTVFGIPVYNSKGTASKPAAPRSAGDSQTRPRLSATQSLKSEAEFQVDSLADKVLGNLQKTNDKVVSALSSIFDRLARVLKQPDSSDNNSNGNSNSNSPQVDNDASFRARVKSLPPLNGIDAPTSQPAIVLSLPKNIR